MEQATDSQAEQAPRGVKALRVETVARYLVKWGDRRKIHDWVARESGWKVSGATVDRMIKRALEITAREAQKQFNLQAEFAMSKARIESLRNAALASAPPDLRTALLCERELIGLLGLAAARPEPAAREREPVEFKIVGVQESEPSA